MTIFLITDLPPPFYSITMAHTVQGTPCLINGTPCTSGLLEKTANDCFSDILKIDNMWNFVSLTKLQMDNNIIEKIEGLEKLVNLEWLGNIG